MAAAHQILGVVAVRQTLAVAVTRRTLAGNRILGGVAVRHRDHWATAHRVADRSRCLEASQPGRWGRTTLHCCLQVCRIERRLPCLL